MAFELSFALYSYVGHRTNGRELDLHCLVLKLRGHIDNVFRGWELTLTLILVKLDIE